jgi:hypothetical protein
MGDGNLEMHAMKEKKSRSKSKSHKFSNINAKAFISVI